MKPFNVVFVDRIMLVLCLQDVCLFVCLSDGFNFNVNETIVTKYFDNNLDHCLTTSSI